MMVVMNLEFYKDYVQTVLPTAQCFMFNESYCIMDIPDDVLKKLRKNEMFSTWPACYSRWQNSAKFAWQDAYERIQLETLEKLEG
jgi:hypothetical protein